MSVVDQSDKDNLTWIWFIGRMSGYNCVTGLYFWRLDMGTRNNEFEWNCQNGAQPFIELKDWLNFHNTYSWLYTFWCITSMNYLKMSFPLTMWNLRYFIHRKQQKHNAEREIILLCHHKNLSQIFSLMPVSVRLRLRLRRDVDCGSELVVSGLWPQWAARPLWPGEVSSSMSLDHQVQGVIQSSGGLMPRFGSSFGILIESSEVVLQTFPLIFIGDPPSGLSI